MSIIENYISDKNVDIEPIFLAGNALDILKKMPNNCIDCCMTSPPYWGKRQYKNGGIGEEETYSEYIESILDICKEIYRVLKKTGSFWLNIGDSYLNKSLLNIPNRVAIKLADEQDWILRNTVIWNKVKGSPDNSKDKLRNIYEPIFHFVKDKKAYYYNIDEIRNNPQKAKMINGRVISATGVSGISYKRKIELSTALSEYEKENALKELNSILNQIAQGTLSDFRMVIKGNQRVTHSDSEKVSGRAKELNENGFYFLKYNPKGSKPSDLWDIIPEDSQGRKTHSAPYPKDLCKTPIILTCPTNGIVLDPFCGSGTTMAVAYEFGRKSIGLDISSVYTELASKRCINNE